MQVCFPSWPPQCRDLPGSCRCPGRCHGNQSRSWTSRTNTAEPYLLGSGTANTVRRMLYLQVIGSIQYNTCKGRIEYNWTVDLNGRYLGSETQCSPLYSFLMNLSKPTRICSLFCWSINEGESSSRTQQTFGGKPQIYIHLNIWNIKYMNMKTLVVLLVGL